MSIRVGMGAGMLPDMAPRDYWRWVALCEDSGIDSIWHSDQLLGQSYEPLVMMAALAARTQRLRFGMNALVVPFREPLVVAKQIASIAHLSDGRLLTTFGVGMAGDRYWKATGSIAAERGKRANEAIALIRALLEQDEVTFEGACYRYEGPGVWPRPARPVPLWIGGDSPAAIRRTAALGDGWLGGLGSADMTASVVARIKAELVATGRRIDDDHYGATVPFRIGAPDDPAVLVMRERLVSRLGLDREEANQIIAAGDAVMVASLFRSHVAGGVAKFVAIPIARDGEDLLDQTRRLAREVVPIIEQAQPQRRPRRVGGVITNGEERHG